MRKSLNKNTHLPPALELIIVTTIQAQKEIVKKNSSIQEDKPHNLEQPKIQPR